LFSNWTLAVIVLMQHPLWWEDGSVVYNCCWPSPAQSFSGPSPAELITTFYCLRYESPPTWRVRSPHLYPPGTGWPSYTPRHWVPFSSPPTARRTTVEVFDPASTRDPEVSSKFCPAYNPGHGPCRTPISRQYFHCWASTRCRGNVFTHSFHSNGCACYIPFPTIPLLLHACCEHYLATAVSLAPQFLLWANMPQYETVPDLFTCRCKFDGYL
jgi:hypothetical protein